MHDKISRKLHVKSMYKLQLATAVSEGIVIFYTASFGAVGNVQRRDRPNNGELWYSRAYKSMSAVSS